MLLETKPRKPPVKTRRGSNSARGVSRQVGVKPVAMGVLSKNLWGKKIEDSNFQKLQVILN